MEDALKLTQLLDSELSVAAVQGADIQTLMVAFKRLSLTTGQAVYNWTPSNGLYRLGAEHILIPRTRQPVDVLSYVLSSRHYGMYLLHEMAEHLRKAPVQSLLKRIVQKQDGVRRLVLLLDEHTEIPAGLEEVVGVVRFTAQRATGTEG
ncbi:hypothetical protein [Alkalilimnicola sp. S0819]|uniref:hypothetical protein n=1 Tax=Alkalilimnicola sp. S0819 TaxID=2613922 RepID=UPI001261EDA3|nr:hypothetical protein [Alkalilimnicola sp. S0819]KAB7623674.1 hypothetical protein F3N43_09145 [Alkalilimnicola sp. S0819]MPQ16800.1 hypothetical protein [Alkalilimnicola sp. S0819]